MRKISIRILFISISILVTSSLLFAHTPSPQDDKHFLFFDTAEGIFDKNTLYYVDIADTNVSPVLLSNDCSCYTPCDPYSYTDEDIDALIKFICASCGIVVSATCLPPGWSHLGVYLCARCASHQLDHLEKNYGK